VLESVLAHKGSLALLATGYLEIAQQLRTSWRSRGVRGRAFDSRSAGSALQEWRNRRARV